MSEINLHDHGLAVLSQPTAEALRDLAEQGVQTVVNLRHAGEFEEGQDAGPLSIEDEGELVRGLGINYVHLPVSMKTADARLATGFEAVLTAAREAGPVAVHCKLGQRAGAMVLIALARHQHWSAERAINEAGRLGLGAVAEVPKLVDYVRRCLPA